MPTPIVNLPALPTPWTVNTSALPTTGAASPPAYTEHDPVLTRRARAAQDYTNQLGLYSEYTRPDSARQLESQRPVALAPTYWQATGRDSPLPEHVETDEATGSNTVRFSPSLNGQQLAQAMKHEHRLDQLLEQAEQLGTLLLEREQEGGTSICAEQVATVCQKIDRLRSSWANGAFAGTSRLGTQLAGQCFPVPRNLRENALNAAIDNLWRTAKTEYQDRYLPDPLNADPILAKVYLMVEGLKKAEI